MILISLTKLKSELPGIVKNYILMMDNNFSAEGYCAKTQRADNEKDNMKLDLIGFCQGAGI